MDEVVITLQQSVDVAIDGAAIACDEVVLRPPTGRVQSQVQAITCALAFMDVIMKETTHGSNPRSD